MKLVKIGGSVLSDKRRDKARGFDENVLKSILDELKGEEDLVLVFGGGSWAHFRAIELGLNNVDWVLGNEDIEDFTYDLEEFHDEIVSFCIINGLEVEVAEVDQIKSVLTENKVPLLFGNVVEVDGKYRVISGDYWLMHIADDEDVKEVVFYTKEGLKLNNGKLVNSFMGSDVDILLKDMKGDDFTDATGGMRGKLESIKKFNFQGKVIFRTL